MPSARVAEVIELIRPAVREDDGDIELVGITADGEVRIRFLG
ncbi:MAG: NifU family protein, partial [Akkermansiaceae bacterium]